MPRGVLNHDLKYCSTCCKAGVVRIIATHRRFNKIYRSLRCTTCGKKTNHIETVPACTKCGAPEPGTTTATKDVAAAVKVLHKATLDLSTPRKKAAMVTVLMELLKNVVAQPE